MPQAARQVVINEVVEVDHRHHVEVKANLVVVVFADDVRFRHHHKLHLISLWVAGPRRAVLRLLDLVVVIVVVLGMMHRRLRHQ